MEATKYPIDFDELQKGDVVSQETIERIYQVTAEHEHYRLKMQQLSGQIEQERPDLVPRCDGYTIRICTDLEADDVTSRRVKNHARGIARNARRRAAIVRDDFTIEQRQVAESRDRAITAMALVTHKELARQRREEVLALAVAKSTKNIVEE